MRVGSAGCERILRQLFVLPEQGRKALEGSGIGQDCRVFGLEAVPFGRAKMRVRLELARERHDSVSGEAVVRPSTTSIALAKRSGTGEPIQVHNHAVAWIARRQRDALGYDKRGEVAAVQASGKGERLQDNKSPVRAKLGILDGRLGRAREAGHRWNRVRGSRRTARVVLE